MGKVSPTGSIFLISEKYVGWWSGCKFILRIQITIVVVIIFSRYWFKSIIRCPNSTNCTNCQFLDYFPNWCILVKSLNKSRTEFRANSGCKVPTLLLWNYLGIVKFYGKLVLFCELMHWDSACIAFGLACIGSQLVGQGIPRAS